MTNESPQPAEAKTPVTLDFEPASMDAGVLRKKAIQPVKGRV